MRTRAFRLAPLVLVLAFVGYGGMQAAARGPKPAGRAPAGKSFSLSTSAFRNNAAIPKQYTADGQGISPPLTWASIPTGTKSLALIVSDPDAPGQVYIHWVLYGLPPNITSLPANLPKSETLPQQGGAKQGKNSAGTIGWTPPNPPPGKVHHYHFRLYALDIPANLVPGATATDVQKMAKGHTLGTAEVVGTYRR